MNVGDYLEDAVAGIARANALTRTHRPTDAAEQATVAVARTQLYRELNRQLYLLTGLDEPTMAALVDAREPDLIVLAKFSAWLRDATRRTDEAMPTRLPDVPVTGPIGTTLHQSALALTIANELIADHVGDRIQPRTPEGLALAAGYQQADHLAATGRLAQAAASLDVRLRLERWLHPTPAAGPWTPLILVADHDVRSSPAADAGRAQVLRFVTAAGARRRGFAWQLESVPLVDDPHRWATVTSARRAVAAMDAARAWLYSHGRDLTADQVNAAARAGLEMTAYIGEVMSRTTHFDSDRVTDMCRAAARPWRNAAFAAAGLRSNLPAGHPKTGVADTALTAVAAWLREHVQSSRSTQGSRQAASVRRHIASRRTVGRIAARLADCAELLRDGVIAVRRSGNLLIAGSLTRPFGSLVQVTQWTLAPAGDPKYRQLINSLALANVRLLALADLTGEQRPPGRREAERAEASRAIHTRPTHDRRPTFPQPATHSASRTAR